MPSSVQKFFQRLRLLRNEAARALFMRRFKAALAIHGRRFFNPHPQKIRIGEKFVGHNAPVFVIAEIGVNHNGDIKEAKWLIDAAADAGADAVKFQKRELSSTYRQDVLDHPERYEQTFQYTIPLLKQLEFGEAAYRELAEHAKKKNIMLIATPFDEPSVDFLRRVIDPPFYKVASADLINVPLLERLIKEQKPLILSTGMSSLDEIDETVAFLNHHGAEFILLHCQSTYPAPPESLNLSMMQRLRKRYGTLVGYSGHEQEIFHTLHAVAMGATVIERHITRKKNQAGPDHPASLEPDEFKELVRRIREFEQARGVAVKQISRGEIVNRMTLRKSVVAAVDIPKGARITREMLAAKSPGTGLSPQRLYDLVGTRAKRTFQKDGMFTEYDISDLKKAPKMLPNFSSKWGLKARFSEIETLLAFSPQPKFLEFHMSDGDLSYNFDTSKRYPIELYVHAPEYFGHDPIDLGSDDPRLWEQSVRIIQQTIDKTREISKSFTGIPTIIIHVGGITIDKHPNPRTLLEQSKKAFRRLDMNGIRVLPENLPPFGWFFSGRWHCNIFCSTDDLKEFCRDLGLSMCLDLSHAWLWCAHTGADYISFIKEVAPYTAHVHIADGRGSYKEGLQIGEGDVPFGEALATLAQYLPQGRKISWVPEIWQGHLHDYLEFRIALAKLAEYPLLK